MRRRFFFCTSLAVLAALPAGAQETPDFRGAPFVMQGGEAVENLTAGDLVERSVAKDYTRNLLRASEGFVRTA